MLRNGLLAGAFVILAVVAAIGWTRAERATSPVNQPANYSQPVNAQSANYSQPATYAQPANYTQPSGYDANGNPSYANGNAAYGSQNPCVDYSPGYQTGGASGTYQTTEYYPQGRYVQVIHRPVVVRRYEQPQRAYTTTEVREVRVHHHRSGKKSAAIVAGSAGVGAAIGALAGGGKGAGIGALAGGAGGFIYDRLTHNR
jgi:hypothetical protein